MEEDNMAEKIVEPVRTATIDRLQPWQALFGILTYVIGAFNIAEVNVIILCGMLLVGLGFVQRSTNQHKEAIKEVVAPWVLERLLKILEEYAPSEPELTPEQIEIEELKAKIALMEEEDTTEE